MKAYIKPTIEIVVTETEEMICLSGGDPTNIVVADAPLRDGFDADDIVELDNFVSEF